MKKQTVGEALGVARDAAWAEKNADAFKKTITDKADVFSNIVGKAAGKYCPKIMQHFSPSEEGIAYMDELFNFMIYCVGLGYHMGAAHAEDRMKGGADGL